ncbi:MAG TPA: creatininase family protein [Thermoplasmatales archaeon]|nr:creatininase family protein [Thermoplasmatales archaeon]HEX17319.1 creatininase family protein [Thermoplasmatales archaeon]
MRVLRIEELNFKTIIEGLDKEKSLILIPFSPLEAHGPHLPIGTDVMVSRRICEEVASNLSKEGITTLIYPPQIIGYCAYTKDFPGSISVDARTLSKVSYDMLESLARQGFKHIMIVSFHLGTCGKGRNLDHATPPSGTG